MGVFGAGNSGAALNKFVAPVIWWWRSAGLLCRMIYAAAMLVTVHPVLVLQPFSDPSHLVPSQGDPVQ